MKNFIALNNQPITFKKPVMIAIVRTEWNNDIVEKIYNDCMNTYKKLDNIDTYTIWVPGAIEIPFAITQCKKNMPIIDAFIALGCVIKGDTPHFDYVCKMVCEGINTLNLNINIPTIMGVLTVNNKKQALQRINKGNEFAISALKMIELNRKFNPK